MIILYLTTIATIILVLFQLPYYFYVTIILGLSIALYVYDYMLDISMDSYDVMLDNMVEITEEAAKQLYHIPEDADISLLPLLSSLTTDELDEVTEYIINNYYGKEVNKDE